MPKYLIKASLTIDGVKGTLQEGGTSRLATLKELFESIGGKLEAFYYAFGDTDAYVIVDAPDNVTTAALSMAVTASGAVVTETVVLLTPEELDQVAEMTIDYRPPGG